MKLSIIIPVLNEVATLGDQLKALLPVEAKSPGHLEILVVDGGSTDGTVALVSAPFKLIESGKGRARQMNRGAEAALGEWLLFLHGDTRLPEGFLHQIDRAGKAGFRAGVFRLSIGGSSPLRKPFLKALLQAFLQALLTGMLKVSNWGANWRTRWRGIFLGDQALFVEKSLFTELGGFPDQPLLEDYALALLLKARGEPLYFSPLSVETSGRRWERNGYFRTWWLMRRVFYRYHRSGSAEEAARLYRDVR